MYRTFALAAAMAALAVPAFAGDITISLAGKTKAQVTAEIHSAAMTVCRDSQAHLDAQLACARGVEEQALSDMATVYAKLSTTTDLAVGPSSGKTARP